VTPKIADEWRIVVSIKRIMNLRFCLSFGLVLAVTTVLVTHRGAPAGDLEGPGIVYVYFPSMCAAPGDPRDCREIPRPARPSFDSMAACSAYADVELQNAHDPRVMASCMKQREG
jgi:hypothetical protein